jgi:hypothetical protein
MKVEFVSYKNIDFVRYNNCVMSSKFSTMYAMSWYLDAVCKHWDILQANDYSYVMPLPFVRKYGIPCFLQPPFCQQLGVFSSAVVDESVLNSFLRAIPFGVKILSLNSGMDDGTNRGASCRLWQLRTNYTLPLDRSFAEIEADFHNNFRRNVKQAQKAGISIRENADLEDWRQLRLNSEFSDKRTVWFEKMLSEIGTNVRVEIWSANTVIQSNHADQLKPTEPLAAVVFIFWNNRVYYFKPVSSAEGKKQNAMSVLLYEFIKKHSQTLQKLRTPIILDFEGSSIESVARYYASTGATVEKYPVYYEPNWIKKLL